MRDKSRDTEQQTIDAYRVKLNRARLARDQAELEISRCERAIRAIEKARYDATKAA